MRILLINYEYPPLGGGGGVFCADLAEELIKQGHTVDVLTSHFDNLPITENKNQVTIFRVKIWGRKNKAKASLLSLLSFPIFSIIQGYKLCKKNKYHIINTHFAIPTGPTGYVLSKIFKIKNILSIHGSDIYDPTRNFHNNPLLKMIIKFMLKSANEVVAQSHNIKMQADLIYNPKRNIRIIPLGIKKPDLSSVETQNFASLQNKKFRFISVGRLVLRKGFDYLIKSLPKNSELILIGDGPEKTNLQEIARQEEKKVTFLGYISEQKKWQNLLSADCYVLSSWHEGFALVCLEAMAAGLPIISTNFGGQTDYLAENINALLVKPKSVSSLHWAMEKIMTDENLRVKMKESNLKTIENYYITGVAIAYINLALKVRGLTADYQSVVKHKKNAS